MEEQNKSKIQKFKEILYSRKNKFSKYNRRKLRKGNEDLDLKDEWENSDELLNKRKEEELYVVREKKSPIFVVILVAAVIFFVGAVSYTFFYLTLNKKETRQKIDVSIIGPNTVNSGSDFKFTVKLENNSDLDFEGISINIKYPESTIDVVSGGVIRNEVKEINEKLLSGGIMKEKFNVILSGIAGDQKDIEVSVIYNAVGFSNIVADTKVYQLGIDSAPVFMEIDYPKSVLSDKEFSIDVDVLSNTNLKLEDLLLMVNLPQSFTVKEFSMEPLFKNRTVAVFKIKSLSPGGKVNLKIVGSMVGQQEEEKAFSFEVGDSDPIESEIRTLFAKAEKEVMIKRPDLQLEVAVNNEYGEDHIIQAKDKIDVKVALRNNLKSVITDLRIEAKVEGNNFDPRTLRTKNSYYDSNNNSIVWDKHTWDSLNALDGGEKISDLFSITAKDLGDLAGYQANPELKLSFKVIGTNFDSANSQGEIVSEFSTIIKTATNLKIESGTMFSSGPFENTGEVPPVVGKKTTYTAVWMLSNSTNLLEDVEVRAKLPYYVKFINNISPKKYYVDFNEDTREITWRIKKLEPFIGYRTPPKTVYFQVEITPSANQIGTILDLIGPKTVVATDKYIDSQISVNQRMSDTTKIEADDNSVRGVGIVKEM